MIRIKNIEKLKLNIPELIEIEDKVNYYLFKFMPLQGPNRFPLYDTITLSKRNPNPKSIKATFEHKNDYAVIVNGDKHYWLTRQELSEFNTVANLFRKIIDSLC